MTYIPDNLRRTRIRDGISRAQCEIYEAFCETANKETGFTYKAIEKIADECEIRRNCSRLYLKELFAKGWLLETFGDSGNGNQVKGVSVKTEKTGWKSYSERTKNVDKKIVTPADNDKKFVGNDKKIVNVDKKIVTPYKEVLNQRINQRINHEEEESHTPAQTPDFEVQNINGKRGISVDQIIPEKLSNTDFRQVCETGMKLRLKTPTRLPKQEEWFRVFNFWQTNDYDADELLETFDLLDEIRQKRGAGWLVTPALVEKNIGKLESLNVELENLENLTNEVSNGSIQPNNKGSYGQQRDTRAVNDYNAVESARYNAEQRRATKLQGSDAARRE